MTRKPIIFPPPRLPIKRKKDEGRKGHEAPLDSWDPKVYLEDAQLSPTQKAILEKRKREKEVKAPLPHHGGRGRPFKPREPERVPEILDQAGL